VLNDPIPPSLREGLHADLDPVLAGAITAARDSLEALRVQLAAQEHHEDFETEALQLARHGLEHLIFGRWDEARAMAEAALELDEIDGTGDRWRDYSLLVEEACATGESPT